jgi:hypothetical protein
MVVSTATRKIMEGAGHELCDAREAREVQVRAIAEGWTWQRSEGRRLVEGGKKALVKRATCT